MRKLFLLLIAVLIWAPAAHAGAALPADYIKYPVSVTLEDGRAASGFYIMDDNGDAYFVTAKHLLFYDQAKEGRSDLKGQKALLSSYPQEDQFQEPILIQLDLKVLNVAGFIYSHETNDVAVIKLGSVVLTPRGKSLQFNGGVDRVVKAGTTPSEGSIVGASRAMIKKYDEVPIGNDVFIFGYPNSLGIENYPQIDYTRPLLRKGVIAGKNNEKKTMILDCPVFYGNSGGPVVETEPIGLSGTSYAIVGMVAEFIPFDDKWYGIQRPFNIREIENSGYSVVVPMDAILEVIEKARQKPAAAVQTELAGPVGEPSA